MSEVDSILAGKRLAFVGAGVMAEAMMSGLLEKRLVAPDHLVASHPNPHRVEDLQERLGIRATTDNRAAVLDADLVAICVKPQRLNPVLNDLAGAVGEGQVVVSIIAGASAATIAKRLSHPAVVRVMPNTPAQIGQGISVWTSTPEVSAEQRRQVKAMLSALGTELWFEEEKFVDMATAISGTGPAYVFLVMEALIDAAVHLGFSRADARQLVTQTLLGSVLFADESHKHPAELRNMVTSPNGTSAEALYQLEKGGLRTILSKAVYAAYQKTKVLKESV